MDAIECGIVKLPRVPVADNIPGAEVPVIAAALHAEIEIANQSGTRKVAFSDFAQGYLTNCLEADEVVTAIHWPIASPSSGAAFHEFNRRPADFAIVSAAVEIVLDAKDAISSAKIALGSASPSMAARSKQPSTRA